MGSRGYKSKAEIETPKPKVVEVNFGKRADAPSDLTPEQARIWRETIASEATDVFATAVTKAMLKDYCRHRSDADRLSQIIDSFKTEWLKSEDGIKRYRALSRERGEETYRAARIATKLRLTNQARYTPQKAGADARRALKGKMPWDEEED